MRFSLKTVLLTALLMTLPSVAAGQLTVGFRGGLSLASLGGDDAGDVGSRANVMPALGATREPPQGRCQAAKAGGRAIWQ